MSLIQATNTSASEARPSNATGLSTPLVLLLAASAGLTVASIYYSQPMLGVLGDDTGASPQALGLVPTLAQLGYALGILLMAPLGDRHDRRTLILVKCAVLVAAMLGAAAAPGIGLLWVASLVIGLGATAAQDVVPAAASLAPDAHRGRVVGSVMTGLLLGILLSRVVSGFVAEHLGWRAMFVLAAASVALLGVALWRRLPHFQPTTNLSYRALMGSMLGLWQRHAPVRRAALAQGALALGFSAVWSTLALWLHGAPFHLGSAAAGAFGVAGAAGALAAPVFGRLSDRHGGRRMALVGAVLALVSFALMALLPWLGREAQLALVVLSVIGFDLGFQGMLVSHQTIIYGADPAARGRLNAMLFVVMFGGMALGAALGTSLFGHWGWSAVTALCVASALLSIAVRLWPDRAAPQST
ncbi:MFS transporter [Hydrogenophaga sp. BPS33]|uniref:MFS transporter n=1 Tax=Hydrogenophaga sp. BPS33 TaxID=2651974 RepID=UPI00131FACEF|nr:MFS transporter [Hydrogenophaga sp. BPS33]QHE86789.1 MFS transporter [Hydrogenophaga sp. BPS33]